MCKSYNNSFRTSRSRPCARCVWTGWRTWSLCAATAPASCVGTEWASAPSAARPSSAASSSTRAPETLLLCKPKQTTSNLPQLHQLLLLDHPHSTRVRQPRASSNVLFFTANALLMAVMEFCYKTKKIHKLTLIRSCCFLSWRQAWKMLASWTVSRSVTHSASLLHHPLLILIFCSTSVGFNWYVEHFPESVMAPLDMGRYKRDKLSHGAALWSRANSEL